MEEAKGQLLVEAGEALPQGRVLSYITTASTPTRVRRLAGIATRCVGMMYGLGMILMLGAIGWDIVDTAGGWHGVGFFSRVWSTGGYMLGQYDVIARLMMAGGLSIMGMMVLLAAGGVQRGRKGACRAAWWGSLIAFLAMFPVVGGLVCGGLVTTYDIFAPTSKFEPLGLLWIIPAGLALLVVMVLLDVLGFLGWIMRHPVTEKPPVPFLYMPKDRSEVQ